jgi:hypothetical protein
MPKRTPKATGRAVAGAGAIHGFSPQPSVRPERRPVGTESKGLGDGKPQPHSTCLRRTSPSCDANTMVQRCSQQGLEGASMNTVGSQEQAALCACARGIFWDSTEWLARANKSMRPPSATTNMTADPAIPEAVAHLRKCNLTPDLRFRFLISNFVWMAR